MDQDDTTYQRLKSNCGCGCYAHCGHSCLTDDCDCNECRCPECRSKFVIGGKILGNNDLY